MSYTYSSNRIHVVFSTKNREKRISEKVQPRVWGYIAGIARTHGFEAIKVGGVEDHVHALLILRPTMPLSKAVQLLKGSSSRHLNKTRVAGDNFAWQEGYGAFSVSASQTEGVVQYIENQPAPHSKRSYEEEVLECLKKYGVAYDPAYVLGWGAVPPGLGFCMVAYPALKRWAKLGRASCVRTAKRCLKNTSWLSLCDQACAARRVRTTPLFLIFCGLLGEDATRIQDQRVFERLLGSGRVALFPQGNA
jgi:putative transposase